MAVEDHTPEWDYRERLARIDKDRAETDKLNAETRKLLVEQTKLIAETRKYRWIDPLLALATLIAALGISRVFGH